MPRLPGAAGILAEILASGGVGWLVRLIQREVTIPDLLGAVRSRFPRLSLGEAQFFVDLTRQAFAAGVEFGRHGVISPERIPINPYLFDPVAGGRRIEYAVSLQLDPRHPQTPEWFEARIETATFQTFQAVASEAYAGAIDRFREKYPHLVSEPELIGVSVSYIQRRF